MDIYAQNIIDHYHAPHNCGRLTEPKLSSSQVNISCGDQIVVDMKIEDDKIKDLKFEADGCAISIAAMSLLSDYLLNKNKAEVLALKYQVQAIFSKRFQANNQDFEFLPILQP